MHVSLDGFVAGENGEMDWIKVDDEIFDFVGSKLNEADSALYGRKTYEMMESYWPTAADQPNATRHDIEHSRWYEKAHKIVLSKTMEGQKKINTVFIGQQAAEKVKEQKRNKGGDIIIFGSPSASHFLTQQELIDEYWLFVNPVLLAKGIPLFKGIYKETKLSLVRSHVFSSGVVFLHYSKK